MGLVMHIMGHITNELALKVAAHSIPAVMAAVPIEPLPGETPQTKEDNWNYYSPHQNYLDYNGSKESESDMDNDEEYDEELLKKQQ